MLVDNSLIIERVTGMAESKERIGNIELDLSWYEGEDQYSDGIAEELELEEIASNYTEDQFNQVIAERKKWPVLYHFSHVRENIVSWTAISKEDKVLEIGSGCGAITGALARKAKSVTCIELSKKRSQINALRHKNCENVNILVGNFEAIETSLTEKYDVITLIGVFEYASTFIQGQTPYEDFLKKVESHLAPGGRIMIAIENRLGLKYFAGCTEDHSGIFGEGLRGYGPDCYARTFSKRELTKLIEKTGFMDYKFYYPYPDYKFPSTIFSDEYLPHKGELATNERNFDRDRMKLFNEQEQFDEIIEDGTFPKYSNSFFVVIEKRNFRRKDPNTLRYGGDEVAYVKFSNERSRQFNIHTVISVAQDGKHTVWKNACAKESVAHVEKMRQYYEQNKERTTIMELAPCKEGREPGQLSFEFVVGQTLAAQLDAIIRWNRQENGSLSEQGFGEIRNCLIAYVKLMGRDMEQTSWKRTREFEEIFGKVELPSDTIALTNVNIDMIPDNILFTEDGVIRIIDYEWVFDMPIPYQYVLYRAIHYYVNSNPNRMLLDEYRLYEELEITKEFLVIARQMEKNFQEYIRKGHQTLAMLHQEICGEVFDGQELFEQKQRQMNDQVVQIYLDKGKGFLESESIVELATRGKELVNLMIPVTENTSAVRIDPSHTSCFVTVNELYVRTERGYKEVSFTSNGVELDRTHILFCAEDPQLILGELPKQCEYICLQMQVKTDISEAILTLLGQREQMKTRMEQLENHLQAVQAQLDGHAASLREFQQSNAWKITKPLRSTVSGLKCLRDNGLSYTIDEVEKKFQKIEPSIPGEDEEFKRWLREAKLKAKQEKKKVTGNIRFSILVPLYNTPERYLKEMLKSVRHQSYSNWELCLADGSDKAHTRVEQICRAYMKHDNRIRYQKLEKNLGISENTNACLRMATGDYIGLFDHDDLLDPAVLNEMAYAIEQENADYLYTDEYVFEGTPYQKRDFHFKPDYAPDSLRGNNYICHFSVFSRELMEQVGEFDPACDGSQDHDYILRLTQKAGKIWHIRKPLYLWRAHPGSVAGDISSKGYAAAAGIHAIEKHLKSLGLSAKVESSKIHPTAYRIKYELQGHPLISILIPSKDHIPDLLKCIQSIEEVSTYDNYEIIIIENNSSMPETFACYEELAKDERIRILTYQGEFNYSAINNFAAREAKGEYLILLNNDTKVIAPEWMEEMLMYCQRRDVGACGAMLYYPDDTVQHSGVIIGIGGVAGHVHVGFPRGDGGCMLRMAYAGNYSAVTAACLMVRSSVFNEVNGLSEEFKVAFNDIDLCLKIRKAGYLIVWTPYAELYHFESKSRGYENTPEKKARFDGEVSHFKECWSDVLEAGDPYFNPNLTLDRGDFYPKELL